MRTSTILTAAAAAIVGFTLALSQPQASGHCQVPCGIYDDPMRITMLREDAATIRKAVESIGSLLKSPGNMMVLNQSVRWVTVKEDTATNIQRVVSDYFLTQRVKAVPADDPGHAAYLDQLARMHAILVAAMKCKQTADLETVNALDAAIEAIAPTYAQDDDG